MSEIALLGWGVGITGLAVQRVRSRELTEDEATS